MTNTEHADPRAEGAPEAEVAGTRSTFERWSRPATLIGASIGAVLSPAAQAATFNVTNLNDAGAGSLRQALDDANGAAGADVVAFQAGLTGTITLTTGQLEITDSVNVTGPGATTITVSGGNASRVFYLYNKGDLIDVTISGLTVTGGAATTGAGIAVFDENLTLDGMTIQGNAASSDGGGVWADGFEMTLRILNSRITGNSSGDDGGGMYVEDTGGPWLIQNTVISGNTAQNSGGGIYFYDPDTNVTIDQSTISGNTAGSVPTGPNAPAGGPGTGGGIYLYSADGGVFTISRTTISGNTAGVGGGVYLYSPDQPTLVENSTISGNTASLAGGGIALNYSSAGSVTLRLDTIAGNTAGIDGGGVMTFGGTTTLDQSIVANNTANAANNDTDSGTVAGSNAPNGSPVNAARFSLIESNQGTLTDNGNNIQGQDPQLGALGNNGGTTQTHVPAAGSAALNAGDPAFAPPPAVDQRGLPRVASGRIDIGSVEVPAGVVGTQSINSISVNEDIGTVTLTVTRSAGATGAVTAFYTTVNGTATAPADYTTTAGQLTWADGDTTSRTILIPIINDTLPEAAESFSVVISATQGGPAVATGTVTILGNDTVAAALPVPTTGSWGQGLLAAALALLGFRWLRRRGRGAAAVLVAGLAAVVVPDAAQARNAAEVVQGRVATVERSGTGYNVSLADGRVIAVDAAKLVFNDRRHHGPRVSTLDQVAAHSSLQIKVRRNQDGSVQRVRVSVIDAGRAERK